MKNGNNFKSEGLTPFLSPQPPEEFLHRSIHPRRLSVATCLHGVRQGHMINPIATKTIMSAERFGEYEVLKREDGSLFELGRGAMGVTYKAFDTDLHRFVALKTISPAAMVHPEAEERFIRETRSAAQLRHPNIAGIFRRDKTPEGTHYYAMEFCEGRTIDQLVKQEGPLEWRRALEISAQAANALAAAARRNLIHRDIKPANLMLVREAEDEGEVLKVIDFGLAKKTADDATTWSSMGTQGFIGTAHFASPEQIQNGIVDTRSDIYSLGATLWFMLLGYPPFNGSIWEVISKHVTAIPDFSLLTVAPEIVVDLIRRMMEKNPADRPQTPRELLDKIKKCLHPETEPVTEVKPVSGAHPKPELTPEVEPESESAPATWTPSLRDLLRTRGELEPVEALRIGEALAAILDEESQACPPQTALLVHGVSIHFRNPVSENEARAKLHEPLTAWPLFDLCVDATDNLVAAETVAPNGSETFFTGDHATGDRVQQLARLLFELIGGIAASQCAPVASLGEKGNGVLRRGIGSGLAEYPCGRDFIEALRTATADIPSRRLSTNKETAPSPSEKKRRNSIRMSQKGFRAFVVCAFLAVASSLAFYWNQLPFTGNSPADVSATSSADTPKFVQTSESPHSPQTAKEPQAPARETPLVVNRNAAVIALCYHNIDEGGKMKALTISTAEFEKEMQAIKDNKFSVIPLQDFLAWRRGEKAIPSKCAVISLDDGWISAYDNAWPILKKYSYPFTLFIYINYIGTGGKSMSWEQLAEMRDAGVDIESHTYSHSNLRAAGEGLDAESSAGVKRDVATLGVDGWLRKEIIESKKLLENRLGIKVTALAYPFGIYSDQVLQIVHEAGYEAAFTVYGQQLVWTAPYDSLGRYAVEASRPQIFRDAMKMIGGRIVSQGPHK
jgi:serine/threonine protein kinase/peptidoglycan/xylan/chitin deacetylase (PgdA/CDA1 family)